MRCVLTASCKQRIANVLLTDRDILEEIHAGRIIIDPFDPLCVQPASYDVRLDSDLLVPDAELDGRGIDPANTDSSMMFKRVQLEDRAHPNQFYIPPGGVALGCTRELVTLSPNAPLAADIAGCSSIGRWFLAVHVTAGFVDPGWSGRLTLELYNASPWWLRIWAGMRIAQVRFYYTHGVPLRSYLDTGHYAGAITALPSQYRG
jgi:dCTP deaminase